MIILIKHRDVTYDVYMLHLTTSQAFNAFVDGIVDFHHQNCPDSVFGSCLSFEDVSPLRKNTFGPL